jgi:hypothetical protein
MAACWIGAAVLFFFVGNVDNIGVHSREIEKPGPKKPGFFV